MSGEVSCYCRCHGTAPAGYCTHCIGKAPVTIPEAKKPPLGIQPRWRWLELRIQEIVAGMDRYLSEGRPFPHEWCSELLDIHGEYERCRKTK